MPIDTSGLPFPKTATRQKALRASLEAKFRSAVRQRDGGRDRATGVELPAGTGHVHHIQTRGAHPGRALDVRNAILLSEEHHALVHPPNGSRATRRLVIIGTDAGTVDDPQPLVFQMLDRAGKLLWETRR